MKIEKKKISENSKWNSATKAGLAALMGIAASTAFVACEDSQSASSQSNPEPLGGVVAAPDIYPENSSSSLNNTNNSSSSEINSPILSSSQSSSSSQVVVDIPKSSSSYNVDEILSSISDSAIIEGPLAGDPIAEPDNLSSSSAPESSSSSNSFLQPRDTIKTIPNNDTLNSILYLCPDSTNKCLIQSMLTTFESTDIDV